VNKATLETLILTLLDRKQSITLHDIAEEAGLDTTDKNRRGIQRALASLIEQDVLASEGAARSRVYIRKNKLDESPIIQDEQSFKGIVLSEKSIKLLRYVSQGVQSRKPVGYNQDFLRSYQPNHSAYLSPALRQELAMIGQAEAVIRPAGTYARTIFNRLLIDLSWNSSRLEGNTYSLLETQRLIESGESATGKGTIEAQMILNHKDAIEYLIESAGEPQTSGHEVCSIHALLSDNLLGDPGASGRLRQIAVGISGTSYLPLDNPHVLKECFDLFIATLNRIEDPFEQSFFSLVHLSYLQAFEDVNKRTARLAANIPLVRNNLKPLSFTDVNSQDYVKALLGIYEKNDLALLSDLYVWAYKRSSQQYSAIQQAMGEPNVFKLKYRAEIQDIIRTIILEKVAGNQTVAKIRQLIAALHYSDLDSTQLQQLIETEIINLHDGNIARFKIKPGEFEQWKNLQ